MSRTDREKTQFRNSSSMMHFYHNGTFNLKRVEQYTPEKYRDRPASTQRCSSYETIKKKRLDRENNFMKIFDQGSDRSNVGSNDNKSIKGSTLNNYIGYLQSLILRLKSFQKQQQNQVKTAQKPKPFKVVHDTQIKNKQPISRFDQQKKQKLIIDRSTSKKQILNYLIDQTKRQKQILKLTDIRRKYKDISLQQHDTPPNNSHFSGKLSQNISSIVKTKQLSNNDSFVSDIPSQLKVSKHQKNQRNDNILDMVDMNPQQMKNCLKKNKFQKQINKWKSQFPEGFFDSF